MGEKAVLATIFGIKLARRLPFLLFFGLFIAMAIFIILFFRRGLNDAEKADREFKEEYDKIYAKIFDHNNNKNTINNMITAHNQTAPPIYFIPHIN